MPADPGACLVHCQISMKERFGENSRRLKVANYCKKAPLEMFNRVLITPLILVIVISSLFRYKRFSEWFLEKKRTQSKGNLVSSRI